MEIAPLPKNERERIESLYSYNILDTEIEKEYDEIVNLASYICKTPIAVISLVDSNRQWFKSKVGLHSNETPRDIAFCAHAINLNDVLVVNDTFNDSRFHDNPLVVENPKIRFYAGAQLKTIDGFVLGALCAIDRKPRELSEDQLNALKILSNQVIAQLELRKSYSELKKYNNQLDHQNKNKNKLLRIISHDLRSPFISILGLTEILKEDIEELTNNEIRDLSESIFETATDSFDLVNNLLDWSIEQSELHIREKIDINIPELLTKLLSVLGGVISKKGIKIITKLETCTVHTDYNIVYSAIQNILTNAIKFTPKEGCITIASVSSEVGSQITINDTGVGLTAAEIDALLSTSGKSSSTGTSGEKGTGLGFAIAKDFINMSGGDISIESELNVGTKVIITFD
jgi:signal transduction histidine kinase